MDKVEKFRDELELIKTDRIRKFAEKAIQDIPDYFFVIPSSSSGRTHSQYGLGHGGLLRHTKAAMHMANELFRQESWDFTEIEKDLILVALLLHDSRKSGEAKEKDGQNLVIDEDTKSYYLSNTKPEHPLLAAEAVLKDKKNCRLLKKTELKTLVGAISSHMGQWNKNYQTNEEILPKPKTKVEKFVHLCDYLASRRFIEVNFTVLERASQERRMRKRGELNREVQEQVKE